MFTSYPFFKLCAFKDRIRPASSKIGCVIVCDCLFLWCVSGEGDSVSREGGGPVRRSPLVDHTGICPRWYFDASLAGVPALEGMSSPER